MLLPSIMIAMAVGQMTWRAAAPAPRVQPKPDLALRVTVSPDLIIPKGKAKGKEADKAKDEGREAAYRKVADTMNEARIGPNNDRRVYFQQHPYPDRILGWRGMIEKVAPAKGGVLVVTVRVQADMDGSYDNFYFNERYSISGREVKYTGCGIHRHADQPYVSSGY